MAAVSPAGLLRESVVSVFVPADAVALHGKVAVHAGHAWETMMLGVWRSPPCFAFYPRTGRSPATRYVLLDKFSGDTGFMGCKDQEGIALEGQVRAGFGGHRCRKPPGSGVCAVL